MESWFDRIKMKKLIVSTIVFLVLSLVFIIVAAILPGAVDVELGDTSFVDTDVLDLAETFKDFGYDKQAGGLYAAYALGVVGIVGFCTVAVLIGLALTTYLVRRHQNKVAVAGPAKRGVQAGAAVCPNCNSKVAKGQNFCPNCGQVMVRVCPKCKTQNAGNFKFCKNCGTDLSKKPLTHCPKCKSAITPEMTFCPACGQNLQEEK